VIICPYVYHCIASRKADILLNLYIVPTFHQNLRDLRLQVLPTTGWLRFDQRGHDVNSKPVAIWTATLRQSLLERRRRVDQQLFAVAM
jgi:hypothetical protein